MALPITSPQANREAPTVVFTSNRGEVGAISTTQAIASNHEAQTDMEKEVAALLRAAGAASTAAVSRSLCVGMNGQECR